MQIRRHFVEILEIYRYSCWNNSQQGSNHDEETWHFVFCGRLFQDEAWHMYQIKVLPTTIKIKPEVIGNSKRQELCNIISQEAHEKSQHPQPTPGLLTQVSRIEIDQYIFHDQLPYPRQHVAWSPKPSYRGPPVCCLCSNFEALNLCHLFSSSRFQQKMRNIKIQNKWRSELES